MEIYLFEDNYARSRIGEQRFESAKLEWWVCGWEWEWEGYSSSEVGDCGTASPPPVVPAANPGAVPMTLCARAAGRAESMAARNTKETILKRTGYIRRISSQTCWT